MSVMYLIMAWNFSCRPIDLVNRHIVAPTTLWLLHSARIHRCRRSVECPHGHCVFSWSHRPYWRLSCVLYSGWDRYAYELLLVWSSNDSKSREMEDDRLDYKELPNVLKFFIIATYNFFFGISIMKWIAKEYQMRAIEATEGWRVDMRPTPTFDTINGSQLTCDSSPSPPWTWSVQVIIIHY